MASRQAQRDAMARALGYRNYTDYRNALAREKGFRNYADERRAKKAQNLAGATVREIRTELPAFGPVEGTQRVLTTLTRGDQNLRGMMKAFLRRGSKKDPKPTGGETFITVTSQLESMRFSVAKWSESGLLSAMQAGYGKAELPPELMSEYKSLQKNITRSMNSAYRNGLDDARRKLTARVQAVGGDRVTRAKANRQVRRGIRGFTGSDGRVIKVGEYGKMIVNANATRAHNVGRLFSSPHTALWEVSDGPGCGWSEHQDTDTANGKIVTREEALAYPLAHPNCQRRFNPRPDLAKKPPSGRVRTAAIAAAAVGGAAVAGGAVALAVNSELRAAVAQATILRAFPQLEQRFSWAARLAGIARAQTVGIDDVAFEMMLASDQFAEAGTATTRVRRLLGVTEEAPAKVVGDAFENLSYYSGQRLRIVNSVAENEFQQVLEDQAKDAVDGWLRDKNRGRFRLRLPNIGRRVYDPESGGTKIIEAFRVPRARLDVNDLVQVQSTYTDKGLFNHLALNRNGLLRAGFTRGPNGVITPTLRLIPKGPLRLSTRVNRSEGRIISWEQGSRVLGERVNKLFPGKTLKLGDRSFTMTAPDAILVGRGKVTSVSAEVRLITRLPVNFRASFNADLRALGLNKLTDLHKLRVGDFRRLQLQAQNTNRPLLKMISVAADTRFQGFNFFEFTRTFRIKWDSAKELWDIAGKYIEAQGPTARARLAEAVAAHRRADFKILTPEDVSDVYTKGLFGPGLEIPEMQQVVDAILHGQTMYEFARRYGIPRGDTLTLWRAALRFITGNPPAGE